jgi:transcriptional regulator with XRE-family HTH domain
MVRTLRPPPTPPAKKSRRTRSAAAPAESIARDVMGERLRSIRKAGKLTLKELSARSGVALSTLSKMELGQISISYEKFAAVARALNVDISRLFDPAARRTGKAAPTFVHSALDSAPSYASDQYEYRMLCTDHPAKIMEPMHGRILARHESEFADFIRHPGQEFCMVLSGTVRIRFETGESVLVRRNESVYFDSSVGHVYLSVGKTQAQVVVVMSGSAGQRP